MPITARIRALTKRESLRRAGTNLQSIVAFQQVHALQAIKRLEVEPPEKAGSKYQRTHTAVGSWSGPETSVTRDGVVTRISNDATDPRGRPYADIVFGDESGEGQNPYGNIAPGWPLMAEELRRGYRERLRSVVRQLFRSE